jgi:general secretion pathway protein K
MKPSSFIACRRTAGPRQQLGVALIYAMLMLAVCTGLIFPRLAQQSVSIAQTANLADMAQAAALADGLDAWVGAVLVEDRRLTSVDHAGEPWSSTVIMPIERAALSGQLVDLRGRINLNAMIDESGQEAVLHTARFRRLLSVLDLPSSLADAVLDWIDRDDVPRLPHGVESAHYVLRTPAYRAANQPFTSVSELRLVAGVTPALFRTLRPHVSALDKRAGINVNTATEAVLMSLAEGLDRGAVRLFMKGRQSKPVRGLADLAEWTLFASPGLETQDLSGVSDWFSLKATIALPRATLEHRAVFRRSDAGTRRLRVWSGDE